MANQHYGRIGDVWKHLPLAEILRIERPAEYWESHAGSARYPLTHSWQRDYGVFHFLSRAAESQPLNGSRYRDVLAACPGFYPGSAEIAMRVLGPETQFLFCDTDPESVQSLRDSARELGIPRVRCENRDGQVELWNELAHLDGARASRLFVHLDPWNCLTASPENGRTGLDLFRELGRKGAHVLLWFGFDSIEQRDSIVGHFDSTGWVGEIRLDIITGPAPERNPGVFGCGIYCANLSSSAIDSADRLGKELSHIYETASFPWGESGRLGLRSHAVKRAA